MTQRQRGAREAKRGIATNTVAQATPTLLGYLASFASAPIVLHSLGLRAFGVWAMTGALAQYASLFDFGVGSALSRFVALHEARDETAQIGEVLGTGALSSTSVFAGLIVVSLLTAGPLAAAVGGISQGSMRTLLLCGTVMFACTMYTNLLTAFNVGVQEMVAPNAALSVGVVLNLGLSVAAVLSSHSLVRYAEANALASLLTLLVVFVWMRTTMRGRVGFALPSRRTAREILSYSAKNQLLTVSTLVNFQTDKIVIALFIGPAVAGAYELANRVAAAARSIGVLIVGGAMVPAMTVTAVGRSARDLSAIYLRWTRHSAVLGAPALIFVASMPQAILHSWLGVVPAHAPLVLAVLCAGYVTDATIGVGQALAYAVGDPGTPARAALATAVGNVAATVALAPLFGLWGVLIGTAAAFTAGALYQVWLVHTRYGIPLSEYTGAVRVPLALALVLIPLPAFAQVAFDGDGRVAQAGAVVAAGAAYALVYGYCALRLGILPAAVRRVIPRSAQLPDPPAI